MNTSSRLLFAWMLVLSPLLAFFSAGCGCQDITMTDGGSLPPKTQGLAVVVGMRGESGVLGLVSPSTLKVTPQVVPVSNDAVVRYFRVGGEGYLFVLNRLSHDNVQVLRASDFRLVKQYTTGSGSNPQDITVVSKEVAYLSLLRKPYLLKINPLTGKELGRISLGSYAEVGETKCKEDKDCKGKLCLQGFCARDGLPEASSLHLHGTKLWVTLQQLDRTKVFAPNNPGRLLIVDTTSDKVTRTLTLAGRNPTQSLVSADKKTLWVVQTGQWFAKDDKPVLDGLVEVFDLDKEQSKGVVLREKTLQGNLATLALTSGDKVFAILSGAARNTSLVEISLKSGVVQKTLARSRCVDKAACYSFYGLKWHPSGRLFVADRDPRKPGVRVFSDKTGKELTASPLDVGLPPMSLLFLPASQGTPSVEPVSDAGELPQEPSLEDGREPVSEPVSEPDGSDGDGGGGEPEPWRESKIEPWPDWNPDASVPDVAGNKPGVGFVQKVVSFKPGPHATHGHDTFPQNLLGPPQGKGHFAGSFHVVSLGCGGEITLEFSNPVIVNGPGVDFVVFENAFTLGDPGDETFSEPATVSVSPNGRRWYTFPCKLKNASWPFSQCAGTAPVHSHPDNKVSPYDVKKAGGNGYDLQTLGLKAVRFVRIRDRSLDLKTSALECSQAQAGFDLDAIAVIWGAKPGK